MSQGIATQEIRELLRQREQQCERLQEEINALRTTISILEAEESKPDHRSDTRPEAGSSKPPNGNGTYPMVTAPKHFP